MVSVMRSVTMEMTGDNDCVYFQGFCVSEIKTSNFDVHVFVPRDNMEPPVRTVLICIE